MPCLTYIILMHEVWMMYVWKGSIKKQKMKNSIYKRILSWKKGHEPIVHRE